MAVGEGKGGGGGVAVGGGVFVGVAVIVDVGVWVGIGVSVGVAVAGGVGVGVEVTVPVGVGVNVGRGVYGRVGLGFNWPTVLIKFWTRPVTAPSGCGVGVDRRDRVEAILWGFPSAKTLRSRSKVGDGVGVRGNSVESAGFPGSALKPGSLVGLPGGVAAVA